ncbi:MAG: FAD-dependent oxidoreductase, partial [Deltaproteobacteria bacterium]|nr:FAD-dependent oxidoreductase [Deltaproteobacteria bacterium]
MPTSYRRRRPADGEGMVMEQRDIVVVGGGASGLSFAWHVAAAGREALVLEQAARLGGCLDTRRCADGFWFELGAHTIYNSYGGLLKVIEGCGLRPAIRERGPARKRFALLRDGRLSVMGPLSVFLRFDPLELALSAPFGLFSSKLGKDAKSYYGKLVGPR